MQAVGDNNGKSVPAGTYVITLTVTESNATINSATVSLTVGTKATQGSWGSCIAVPLLTDSVLPPCCRRPGIAC
jgi:hypothetical protein